MSYSIAPTTKLPQPRDMSLRCGAWLWHQTLSELRRRCRGVSESGAFLLGRRDVKCQRVLHSAYYDDLDYEALDTGIVRFRSSGYAALWRACEKHNLEVLADVHCHPHGAQQSTSDQAHPMIPCAGHTAIIIPNFAASTWKLSEVGVYGYHGHGRWTNEGSPRWVTPLSLELRGVQ